MSRRKPAREKKAENKDMRNLLLALYNTSSLRLLWLGPISEELREGIFRAAQTESFIAKRRYEREVVNLMRIEEDEGIAFLQDLIADETPFLEAFSAKLKSYRDMLSDLEELSSFVDAYPNINVQLLRQRIRNHEQKQSSKTQVLLDELLTPLLFPLDWE